MRRRSQRPCTHCSRHPSSPTPNTSFPKIRDRLGIEALEGIHPGASREGDREHVECDAACFRVPSTSPYSSPHRLTPPDHISSAQRPSTPREAIPVPRITARFLAHCWDHPHPSKRGLLPIRPTCSPPPPPPSKSSPLNLRCGARSAVGLLLSPTAVLCSYSVREKLPVSAPAFAREQLICSRGVQECASTLKPISRRVLSGSLAVLLPRIPPPGVRPARAALSPSPRAGKTSPRHSEAWHHRGGLRDWQPRVSSRRFPRVRGGVRGPGGVGLPEGCQSL